MINVEISNVKDVNADCSIEVSGESELIYNELVQLFVRLLCNDETAKILYAALEKSMEVF